MNPMVEAYLAAKEQEKQEKILQKIKSGRKK